MKIDRKSLAEKAKELGFTMPQVQLLLAQERFVVRVATVPDGQNMIWKGGSIVLRAFQNLKKPRYTVDLDFLARGIDLDSVDSIFKKAADIHLDDGFQFGGFGKRMMMRDTPYGGFRYEIEWTINQRPGPQKLKVDVCTGDLVTPLSKEAREVSVFSTDSISISIYPPEYILAEKLETISRLKTGNTRTKDLVDIWSLRSSVSDSECKSAIENCYRNRGTHFDLAEISAILADSTLAAYHSQQIAKKYPHHGLPSYQALVNDICSFLTKLVNA